MAYAFTRESEVRAAFWQGWRGCPRPKKVAGDWPTDIRCEFVDFVDMLARDRHISGALAQRVTL